MDQITLLRRVEGINNLKGLTMDVKKDILINVFLAYANSPEVTTACWRGGFHLSKTLEEAIIEANNGQLPEQMQGTSSIPVTPEINRPAAASRPPLPQRPGAPPPRRPRR